MTSELGAALVAAVLGLLTGGATGYAERLRSRALIAATVVATVLPVFWLTQLDSVTAGVTYFATWAIAALVARHLAAKRLAALAREPEDSTPAA